MNFEKPQNTEAQKPVEKTEQVVTEQNIEQILSPEQIEQIMAKVQDINQDGVAFSLVKTSKFENVINEGILGSYEEPMAIQTTEINKSDWAKKTRKEKNSNVYFNITGRQDREHYYGEMEILNSRYVAEHWYSKDHIVILFDISKYKEEAPVPERRIEGAKYNNKTYRAYNPWLSDSFEKMSEQEKKEYFNGTSKVYDEQGFTLSHRVPPRYFQGIVVDFMPNELWVEGGNNLTDEHLVSLSRAKPEFHERLKPYLNILFANKKPEELVPIYDGFGDLCWPKQMDYEEVKKFVTERDAKNTNKEEK